MSVLSYYYIFVNIMFVLIVVTNLIYFGSYRKDICKNNLLGCAPDAKPPKDSNP